jgi:soluble lytic murein transglycosylase-like protein
MDEKSIPDYVENLERGDIILPYYQAPATKPATLDFFATIAQSEGVARDILENSERFGVKPALAFALALEESGFRVDALNKNGDSVDRGLFQLNSKSYPGLKIQDFYDPQTNSRYGISHLKSCLSQAGNEVAALAMYNAGNGRVSRDATPQRTLNYISRILGYEANISSLFAAKVLGRPQAAPSLAKLIAESATLGLVSETASKKD